MNELSSATIKAMKNAIAQHQNELYGLLVDLAEAEGLSSDNEKLMLMLLADVKGVEDRCCALIELLAEGYPVKDCNEHQLYNQRTVENWYKVHFERD